MVWDSATYGGENKLLEVQSMMVGKPNKKSGQSCTYTENKKLVKVTRT